MSDHVFLLLWLQAQENAAAAKEEAERAKEDAERAKKEAEKARCGVM